ncbi:MAG: efflux RND transporter periplasmic adaptor subunit [Bacteroidia bacterium]
MPDDPMKSPYVFLILLIFSACSTPDEVSPIRDVIEENVFAAGTLDASDRYMLTAQTDGTIQQLFIKEQDSVQVGEIAVVIDNAVNNANASAAELQRGIAASNLRDDAPAIAEKQEALKLAKAKEQQEQLNLDRFTSLLAKGSVSKLEFEQAELSFKAAQTSRESLEQQIKLLQQQYREKYIAQDAQALAASTLNEFNKISIPQAGKVFKVFKKKGDYVRKGESIASIANSATLVARLNIEESGFARIREGMSVSIKLNILPDSVIKGKLGVIYPMFDEASQSYLADVPLSLPPNLQALGTRLEANIAVARRDKVLLIPRKYLSYDNSVRIKGAEGLRKINVGIKSTEWVEVLDGLAETDVLLPLKP